MSSDPSGAVINTNIQPSISIFLDLAKLGRLEYLEARIEAAKRMQIGVRELDRHVAECRLLAATERARTDGKLVLSPGNPQEAASEFLRVHHTVHCNLTLRHRDASFWRWDGTRYLSTVNDEIKANLYKFLVFAMRVHDGDLHPFSPKRTSVADVLECLMAASRIPEDAQAPCWLDNGDRPDPRAVISFLRSILGPVPWDLRRRVETNFRADIWINGVYFWYWIPRQRTNAIIRMISQDRRHFKCLQLGLLANNWPSNPDFIPPKGIDRTKQAKTTSSEGKRLHL